MLKYDRAAKDSEKVSGYNVANKADEAALYFLVLRDHISPRAICLFQMILFTLLFFLFSFSFLFLLSSQFPLCSKTIIYFFSFFLSMRNCFFLNNILLTPLLELFFPNETSTFFLSLSVVSIVGFRAEVIPPFLYFFLFDF